MSSYRFKHVLVHTVAASVAVVQTVFDARAIAAFVHAYSVLPSQIVLIANLYVAPVYMK